MHETLLKLFQIAVLIVVPLAMGLAVEFGCSFVLNRLRAWRCGGKDEPSDVTPD